MAEEGFERFGKYFLLTRLAFGGMAEIYLARPATASANGRILILKRILPHVTQDPSFVRMFQSEIQISMAFNHPNLVQIHDFGQTEQQPYIAMEYVEGKNLRELSAKFARLNQNVPIPVAASIIAQAAAGLHYAHTFKNHVTGEVLRIIHRDISPHNILVSYEGNVKIIDFGIAKSDSAFADQTSAGTIKGKINYLSPEQLMSEPIDARSDVFSLGIVLWELLSGRKLFHLPGRSDLEVMQMIAQCDDVIQRPSSQRSGIPETLDEITMKALRMRPEERYQSAEEFQKALSSFIMTELTSLSYREVGKVIKDVFLTELTEERINLKVLNERAQCSLQSEVTSSEETRILGNPSDTDEPSHPSGHRNHSSSAPMRRGSLTHLPRPPVDRNFDESIAAPAEDFPTALAPALNVVAKVREQLYIRLTFERALLFLSFSASVFLYSLDRARQNSEHPVIRMAMTRPVAEALPEVAPAAQSTIAATPQIQPHALPKDQATLRLEEVQRAFAKVEKADRQPASGNHSILLRIKLKLKKGPVATGLFVNDQELSLEEPELQVPLDEKVSIQVQRKGLPPVFRTIGLRSTALRGRSEFELDFPLR